MSETKILSLIPESLHKQLIQEVKEIIKKEKESEFSKKPTEKEIQDIVNHL